MTKVRLMAADASPSLTDLFYMVIDPATTPADRKVVGTAIATMLAGAPDFADTYVAQTSQIRSLKDAAYGAVGDGVTDDTAAVQAALDAGAGGAVFIPFGDFKVTAPVVVHSNTELFGTGPGSVIKGVYAAAGGQCVVKNDWGGGATGITLRNFRVDRSGANAEHGVLLDGIDGLLIDGIEIVGVAAVTSGALSVSGVGPGTPTGSTDVRVVNCRVANSDNFGLHLGEVTRGLVANNTIDGFRECVGVEPYTGVAKDIAVIGNTITTPGVGNGSSTGIIIVTVSSGGTIDGVTVEGNTIRCTDTTPVAVAMPGIQQLGGVDVIIRGNTIVDMPGCGVTVGNITYAVDGCLVQGNMISNCNRGANASPSGAGIGLRNATHVIVTGNHIEGAAHTCSVEETSAAANNLIQGNILLDTTKYGAAIGNGTIIYGNKEVDGEVGLRFGAGLANPFMTINGSVSARDLRWQTAGVDRWLLRATSDAEGGANAGSNLQLVARADDGSNLGPALEVTRSSLRVRAGGVLEIDGALDHDGTGVGFYGTAPIAKQTGVAVTAAGVHAALVALGLIT